MSVVAPQARGRFAIACAEITPPVGMYHRMWGAATHDRSEGVHRPLFATIAIFAPPSPKDPAAPLIIASLDHCLVGEAELDLLLTPIAEQSGLAREAVTLLFSHTHGAGLMTLDRQAFPGGEGIPDYLRSVGQTLARLVAEALGRLEPATMVCGTGRCSLAVYRDQWDAVRHQYVCGYDPSVPADDALLVARVTSDVSDRTLATIVNYACHPTTLAWDNRRVSPDYIGALREVVERETGAPCLFVQGASGELGPKEGYVGDVAVADRNGRQLAYASLATLESLSPPLTAYAYAGPVVSGATIGVWRYEPLDEASLTALGDWRSERPVLPLAYRPDLPTAEWVADELARCEREEEAARAAGDEERARDFRALAERQTRMARRLTQLPPGPHYPLEVRVWRMGNVRWIAAPGEHYSLLQTALRAARPELAIFVATIAQGWGPSYIPVRETYGRGIYQESIAVVAPGSLEQIIETLIPLL
ncbi:MAG: hypothetical protein U0939_05570 [Pirellulales bacterium]